MVKCSECGFLSLFYQDQEELRYADKQYRAEGKPLPRRSVPDTPICFLNKYSLDKEVEEMKEGSPYFQLTPDGMGGFAKHPEWRERHYQANLAVITEERSCNGFEKWNPWINPKEHREMLDRNSERKWRIIEGLIFAAVAGAFALLGAYLAS
jgi:hypothetical protein